VKHFGGNIHTNSRCLFERFVKENAVTGSVVKGAEIGAGRNEVENTLETRALPPLSRRSE
jgi:hypothetical protein